MGVSIALFNQISRIAIFPLVSVTTSFVAKEDSVKGARLDFKEDDLSSHDNEDKMLIPQKGDASFYYY